MPLTSRTRATRTERQGTLTPPRQAREAIMGSVGDRTSKNCHKDGSQHRSPQRTVCGTSSQTQKWEAARASRSMQTHGACHRTRPNHHSCTRAYAWPTRTSRRPRARRPHGGNKREHNQAPPSTCYVKPTIETHLPGKAAHLSPQRCQPPCRWDTPVQPRRRGYRRFNFGTKGWNTGGSGPQPTLSHQQSDATHTHSQWKATDITSTNPAPNRCQPPTPMGHARSTP